MSRCPMCLCFVSFFSSFPKPHAHSSDVLGFPPARPRSVHFFFAVFPFSGTLFFFNVSDFARVKISHVIMSHTWFQSFVFRIFATSPLLFLGAGLGWCFPTAMTSLPDMLSPPFISLLPFAP